MCPKYAGNLIIVNIKINNIFTDDHLPFCGSSIVRLNVRVSVPTMNHLSASSRRRFLILCSFQHDTEPLIGVRLNRPAYKNTDWMEHSCSNVIYTHSVVFFPPKI